MGKVCSICNHKKKLQIEREYAKGKAFSVISRKFNISRNAVEYHCQNHISRQLLKAWEIKQAYEGMDIITEIEDLVYRTKDILSQAEEKKNYGLALNAIREARGGYELLAKIAYSLHQAKIAEIELEKVKQGEDKNLENKEVADRLQILTELELKVLLLIQKKVRNQDANLNALPKRLQGETDHEFFNEVLMDAPEAEVVQNDSDDDDIEEITYTKYEPADNYEKEIPFTRRKSSIVKAKRL